MTESIDHICETGIALELVYGKLTINDVKFLVRIYPLDLDKILKDKEFFEGIDVTYSGAGTPLYSGVPEDYCEECFKVKFENDYKYNKNKNNNYKGLVSMIRENNCDVDKKIA